jgi:hypothetical protein
MIELAAPKEYWITPAYILDDITGGCGPGGLGDFLVPDRLDWPWPWGLSIKKACRIHDYMYHVGETRADKKLADEVFLNNMIRIINNARKTWFGRQRFKQRLKRAEAYYYAVHRFGGPAYWKGKDSKEREDVWKAGSLQLGYC